MLTQEEDVEASALRRRGWSISAIARHLGRDRKTIRAYLAGVRRPGKRRPAAPDHFAPFEPYARERLREDPHLWATALYDELRALGYERSYQVLTRELRLRPDPGQKKTPRLAGLSGGSSGRTRTCNPPVNSSSGCGALRREPA
ncbi:MAG: helix-turn-helix domain-containing protein [Phycisphaerales bacterium]|nr:helix-turn-helix domain-containing protein [Phycisphaerales bacterium]